MYPVNGGVPLVFPTRFLLIISSLLHGISKSALAYGDDYNVFTSLISTVVMQKVLLLSKIHVIS